MIYSQNFINTIAKDPRLAEAMNTIWINTGIRTVPGSEILFCGAIPVGNLTVVYRIPNVKGTYNAT